MSDWTGVVGAAVGGMFALGGIPLAHWFQNAKQRRVDKARKGLLRKALKGAAGDGWMTIETLAQIVGAEPEQTRALLIEIDARGSKGENEVWSLISRNPLEQS